MSYKIKSDTGDYTIRLQSVRDTPRGTFVSSGGYRTYRQVTICIEKDNNGQPTEQILNILNSEFPNYILTQQPSVSAPENTICIYFSMTLLKVEQ